MADGEVGEIVIRNNATFLEYWNNPDATSRAFRGGWLRTGDLGRRDGDGDFYIVGRAKEVVRRKGVNIAPAEIENAMGEIAEVDEAALVGVPSPLGEEQAIVVVTLAPGVWPPSSCTARRSRTPRDGAEGRIMARLATLISREKQPDAVVVTDSLPKTSTHRVERTRLREWLQTREGLRLPSTPRP